MTARFTDHILPADVVANRPAATAVPNGTLFPATDTGIIYQSDGAAWSTWATLGGPAYTDEQVRDVMGVALVAGANVTITPNDAGDTITIAASATAATSSRAHLTRSANQSLTASTWNQITWDTEVADTDGYHSTSTNTSRITIPTTGIYVVSAQLYQAGTTAADRTTEIRKNGVSTNAGSVARAKHNGVSADWCVPLTSPPLSLIAGDYFEVFTYVTGSGFSAQYDLSWFAIERRA